MITFFETPIIGRVRVCLELVRKLDLKGKVLLDVGATFGWLEKELQNDGLKEIIGLEPSQQALEIAKKQLPKVKFIQATADAVPLKNSSVDIITFFDVLEHLPKGSEEQVLKELNRVLKKSGVLLLSTPNNHLIANLADPAYLLGHRHYNHVKLSAMLVKTGFSIREYEVKGGLVSLFALLFFYFCKWVLRIKKPIGWLNSLDDRDYNQPGLVTIFLIAEKL